MQLARVALPGGPTATSPTASTTTYGRPSKLKSQRTGLGARFRGRAASTLFEVLLQLRVDRSHKLPQHRRHDWTQQSADAPRLRSDDLSQPRPFRDRFKLERVVHLADFHGPAVRKPDRPVELRELVLDHSEALDLDSVTRAPTEWNGRSRSWRRP